MERSLALLGECATWRHAPGASLGTPWLSGKRLPSAPSATAPTVIVPPAPITGNDVWATHLVANNAANHGSNWPRDDGARTCADAGAFNLPGLGADRCDSQGCA
jgi:hypothetical protein